MLEFIARLFDPTGFTPRSACGESWNPALIWLHIGSDLFIWLAYLSIPLILLYFTRRRDLPFSRLFVLSALFILACGFGHLLEALMFQYPLYRLSGVWKLFTAVVSWATVFALIPVVPRVMSALTAARPSPPPAGTGDTTTHHLVLRGLRGRTNDYIVAVLAGVLALLVRASIDNLVRADHVYMISLVAVVFVSWQSGFGPGVVTLSVSMVGMVYFFVHPRRSFVVEDFGNQLATALFFFCGVCCAALGEAQRVASRKARESLVAALAQRDELTAEVSRRQTVEAELRASEERWRSVLDAAELGAWNIDPATNTLVSDERFRLIFHGSAAPITYEQAFAAIHPDDRQRVRDAVAAATRSDAPAPYAEEYRVVHPDGSVHWVYGKGRASFEPVGDGRQLVGFDGTIADITQRRETEEAVRESEVRFRNMADTVPALIWVADLDRRRSYFNRTWLEFTGRTSDEELGDGWVADVHPDDRGAYLAAYSEAYELRKPFEIEYRLRRHDGVYRWVLARGVPRLTPSGKFAGLVGLCLDVTDRKAADAAVRESEARFRTLTEAVPQMVWTADPKGEVTFFNRRWDEFTGRPLERGRDLGWDDIVHVDDAGQLRAEWQLAVARQPDLFTNEFRLRRDSDGAYRWVLSTAVPLRDATGGVAEWVGSITDIDDQKRYSETLERTVRDRTAALVEQVEERTRAEAEVRQQREFLDAILANVTDGIVACDETGTLTLFNRAAQEFHSVPPRPLAADQWAGEYDLYRADGVTPLPKEEIPLFRALRGEPVRDAEMIIAPRGRAPRFVLASGQRLTDADGHNLGAVVSMRDLTERREADRQIAEAAAELRRTNAELARSNGELEQFAYVASHDLQEPLRKIQAFGDRLVTKFREQLPDAGKEYVDRMLVSASRMRRLIDDLLTYSRVTTQARPFVPIDLSKLVREVVSDLSDRIEHAGAEVRVGELPTIDADPTQMRQLFQNLISNAVKFQRPGVPPVVEVSAETVDEPAPEGEPVQVCRVTVKDNGIGFDEKYLDRIFQVFQRLHGREQYEGTGVGLAICRKITERHGGHITARSRPGEGSEFLITLPLRHPTPPDAQTAELGG